MFLVAQGSDVGAGFHPHPQQLVQSMHHSGANSASAASSDGLGRAGGSKTTSKQPHPKSLSSNVVNNNSTGKDVYSLVLKERLVHLYLTVSVNNGGGGSVSSSVASSNSIVVPVR